MPLLSRQKTAQLCVGAAQKGRWDFPDYSAGTHEQLRIRTKAIIVKNGNRVNEKRTTHSVRPLLTIVGCSKNFCEHGNSEEKSATKIHFLLPPLKLSSSRPN